MKLQFQYPGHKSCMIGVCLIVFALGMGLLVISDIADFAQRINVRKPVLEVDHHTSILVVSLPAMLSIGLLALFSKPAVSAVPKNTARRKKRADRQSRWGQWYILYIFASILIAIFSPIPQFLFLDHILTQRGYVFCPAPLVSRNQPDRWALPGPHGETERCPREGAVTAKP